MSHDVDPEHRPVAEPSGGAQASNPAGGDCSGCGAEHGLRAGAGGDRGDSRDTRDTRPENATRFIETRLGTLSYAELAPLLAERVALLELGLFEDECFASSALDEQLVRNIHLGIAGDLVPDWAGRWRDIEVMVGKLSPPAPWQLPTLMRDYGLDLQARWRGAISGDPELLLEFLAFAEGRFLTVHPFRDFNGRTIRVFLLELMRRLDLPRVELAPQTDTGRAGYFAALEAADQADWQPLMGIWERRLTLA
ncbi:MAG: Fic family protein [Verrucomicrobiaceae bacterium]|nr:Fic family protein [Verrucomicrobiaceae bacterium]